MPSIQVTGQLVDPTTGVEGSADIRIASVINYGQTTKKSISHKSTDASGNYGFQLVYGKHLIFVKYEDERIYIPIGYAVVGDSTPDPIDLIQLINLSDENPPSELVTELQQLREDTLNDIVDTSAQVLENAGYQGEWVSGTSTALKGETWQVSGRYYVALKNTSVDPINDNDNWREVVNTESVTTAQNDIVGGSIFKGSNGEYVQNGDTVPVGTTHLRVLVGGKPAIVAMFPELFGEVSALGNTNAVIGGSTTTLYTKSQDSIKLSSLCPPKGYQVDQAEEVQSAFDFCSDNDIELLVDDEYWVEARPLPMDNEAFTRNIGIYVPSGSRSKFIGNGCLKLIPNDHSISYVVNFYLRDNIEMVDSVVYGDKDEHLGTSGEFGHCYNITSCSNVTIKNPKAFNAWGDGYYVGLEYWTTQAKHLENVKIVGAEYDNCSRNGISFCSGKNVKIELLRGSNVTRILPKSGVDIEPEVGANSPINPTYENCVLDLNLKGDMTSGLLVFLSRPDVIDNCDIKVNKLHTDISGVCLQLEKTAPSNIDGLINIIDFTSTGTETYPVFVKWALDDLNVHCSSATLKNSNNKGPVADPQSYSVVIPSVSSGVEGGGFFFDKIIRIGEVNTPNLVKASGNLSNYSLNFISDIEPEASTALAVLNAPVVGELTQSFYLANSKNLAVTDVNLEPSTFDGITVTLSPNVRFKQTYRKNSTTFPVKFEPESGVTLSMEGSQYSSIQSTSYNARCEIIDDGSGNKTLIPVIGDWTGS